MAVSRRGVEAGRAYLRLLLDTTSAENDLDKYEGVLKQRLTAISRVSTVATGIGASLTLPFVAAIRVASDAQETLNKFEAVLGRQSKAAQDFANTYSGAMTQARRSSQETLASFFAQFRGLGESAKQSRLIAQELSGAVADFESFNNLESGETLRRVLSAIAGEIEPLRRFGIDVSDNRINQELLQQGVTGGTRGADFLEKAQLRAKIILDTIKELNITGDVERTFGALANQVRGVIRATVNAADTIGSQFLPILERITPVVISAIESAEKFTVEFPELAVAAGVASVALFGIGGAVGATSLAILATLPTLRAARSLYLAFSAAKVADTVATTANAAASTAATAINNVLDKSVFDGAAAFAAHAFAVNLATKNLLAYQAAAASTAGSQGLLTLSGALAAGQTGGAAPQLLLAGPGGGSSAKSVAAGTVTAVRTLGTRTNQVLTPMQRVLASISRTMKNLFPTFIAWGLQLGKIGAIFGVVKAAAGGALATIAGFLTLGTAGVAVAVGAVTVLGYQYLQLRREQRELERSTESLADAFDRYAESVAESNTFDAQKSYDAASESAERLAKTLENLRRVRQQLRDLEKLGQGESIEAENLRRRDRALREQADQEAREAAGKAEAADPLQASQAFRDERARIGRRINAIGTEIEATPSDRTAVIDRLEAERRGLQERYETLSTAIDPALELIQRGLRDEVEGGTAANPEARLKELRDTAVALERFYREYGEKGPGSEAQAGRFRALIEEADRTIPSLIGGRDAPVLAGEAGGDSTLKSEEERRVQIKKQADDEIEKARINSLDSQLEKELANIEAVRKKRAEAARQQGSDQDTINRINLAAELQSESAKQENRRRAERRTDGLRFDTERLEIQAGQGGKSDAEIDSTLIELERRRALANGDLNQEDRGLINRRFDAEQRLLLAQTEDRFSQDERRARQQRLGLDVADLFTQNPATALAIGPPASETQRIGDLTEEQNGILRRIEQNIGGVLGN